MGIKMNIQDIISLIRVVGTFISGLIGVHLVEQWPIITDVRCMLGTAMATAAFGLVIKDWANVGSKIASFQQSNSDASK